MSWESDIEKFASKLLRAKETLLQRCAERVHKSITSGDPTTGSPGVPVLSGDLERSWQVREIDGGNFIEVFSDSPYAAKAEFSASSLDGNGGFTWEPPS